MTDLTIDQANANGVAILAPQGRVDTNTAKTFENAAMALIQGGEKAMVFDFGGLDYISSAGLRVVLLAGKRMKSAGGNLVLCNMNDGIRDVFEISGFLELFDVRGDRTSAVDAASPN